MELWQDSPSEKSIEITINAIENVIRRDTINISFIVEHNDNILGESTSIKIDPNFNEPPPAHEINFVVNFTMIPNDKNSIEPVVSIPIIIKAVRTLANEKEGTSTISDVETKKKTKFTTKSTSPSTSEVIGVCSLDLMPILLGEKLFTEKLVLETPQFWFDGTSVSWQNLPLLTVTVWQDDVPMFSPDEKVNFLNITAESMYNLPGSFTEKLEYTAGTIAYTDSEVPENVIFENGKWTKHRDVERTKRWSTLSELENRARLSKYKLDCDFMNVKNEFRKEFDLAKKVCEDVPRVEWNSINRSILWETGAEIMQKHITKYNYWPFQFMLMQKVPEIKSKDKSSIKPQLYQCYVDISELLFPGKRSTRVVTQLHTYNPTDISEKVGLEKNILVFASDGKELKDKEKRNKTSKNPQSVQSEAEAPPSVELISENGEPTVIVIEIELHQPLIPCRIADDFSNLIADMIPEKEKKPRYPYSGEVAEEQYANCIKKLAEILTESYRDFHDESRNENAGAFGTVENDNNESDGKKQRTHCYDPKLDELTCFTQYLYKTGVYLTLRTTLRSKVITLLDQKMKMPPNIVDSSETQNFIASTYTYLVEQMHVAINQIVECRYAENLSLTTSSEKLYFYAEEAYELGYLDDARHYYTTVISSNKNDPKAWTKYAIFLLKIGDTKRAKECCLEAISLNGRYKLALLIYASILFGNREYREAEIFFRAITDLYSRFTEGWTILHLFYIRTEYYPGVDITIRIAEKCIKDKDRETEIDEEPLAWSIIHCPRDSVYALTAIFLLKLHLCEFAGIALAQEMCNAGRSTHVLYYMAVEHYLSGRYEDALSHLKEAQCNYGMDYSISSLMGHCHFQVGDFQKSIECYEFAHMLFDRPDDLHLVEVRMGLHYQTMAEYQKAKKVFLSACKSSPTSQTWFGAGISFYQLNEFKQAETALSEANRIDNRNANIWGYLCLLNMALERYDEFSQCYREMIKNNLKNRKLWLMITKSMEALGYTPPILTAESENDNLTEDYSTEEFEEQ